MNSLEEQHQIALLKWAALERYADGVVADWLIAIPNGGHRHKAVGARLKASGVKKGVSDLFLPVPTGTMAGLWIELKAPKTARSAAGKPTPEQLEWLDRMASQGYATAICWGWESARDTIRSYLAGKQIG